MISTAALIVAAGRGHRLGASLPKQYLPLAGEPVLRRAVAPFATDVRFDVVRVVIDPKDDALFRQAVSGLPKVSATAGGPTRQESVLLGLESLADDRPDHVFIHDAARPFVTTAIIDRLFAALSSAPAAIAALPLQDTLKRAGAGSEATVIEATIPRERLWRAQTPQAFHFAPLLDAHRRVAGAALTDDAAVCECAGLPVVLVPGDEDNLKLTTPDDWRRGEWQLAARTETRTGIGFDVHRFGSGDHVMLCGVRIAHDAGLEGHSDADVALHALTDALLGTIGDGDIGSHFPPSDPRWRGMASSVFLEHAAARVRAVGGAIVHVDLTVICEQPRLGPHRQTMRATIAKILAIELARVSVKATTTERLGFTGRREGIAAQAVATVRLPTPDSSDVRLGFDPDPVEEGGIAASDR